MIFFDQFDQDDCFSVCVASILEIDPKDVPNYQYNKNWWTLFQDWLLNYNYIAFCYDKCNFITNKYCIVSGKSPHGDCLHSTIWLNGKMIHDPHPSKKGILTILDTIILEKLNHDFYAN